MPDVLVPISEGEVVDLASGRSSVVAAPKVDGSELNITDGAANGSTFVALGRICPDDACGPGPLASFSLDPASETWSQLDVPASWAAAEEPTVSYVQATGEDRFVAVVTIGPEQSVAVLSGGVWREAASIDARSAERCATATDLYELQVEGGGGELSPPSASASVGFRRLDLETGGVTEPGLPPVSSAFGSAGLALGCAPGSVYLSSGEPPAGGDEAVVAGGVFVLGNGGWTEIAGIFGAKTSEPVYPGEIISGGAGVLVGGWIPGAEPTSAKDLRWSHVDADGRARPVALPNDGRDADFCWAGSSDGLVVVTTPPAGGAVTATVVALS